MRKLLLILFLILLPSAANAAVTTTVIEAGTAETNDLTFWTDVFTSGTGSAASVASPSYSGGRSLELSAGATGGGNAVYSPFQNNPVLDSGSQVSFYFNPSAAPASGGRILVIGSNHTVNTIEYALIFNNGILISSPTGATSVNGVTTLSANTWYRICLSYYVTNSTTFAFKVYVQTAGSNTVTLDSTANAGTMSATGQTGMYFRINSQTANVNYFFQNIYVATGGASSSSQPDTGNILVTAKRPFANGTLTRFTPVGTPSGGTGSGHAPYVSERPLDISAYVDYVGITSPEAEEYNIEPAATGDVGLGGGNIVDYMGWLYASSTTGETGSLVLAGTNYNISLTSTNTLFTQAAGSTKYPPGTGSDIGIATTAAASTVSLYEAGVLIAYKPNKGFTNFLN